MAVTFNTSNLIKHLKHQHKEEYSDTKTTTATSSCETQQPTLKETLHRWEKMPRDSLKATYITKTITEFIALYDQPLSIVDNVGCSCLLNLLEPKYEITSSRYIGPPYWRCTTSWKKHFKGMLQNITALTFTTDIWTSSLCHQLTWAVDRCRIFSPTNLARSKALFEVVFEEMIHIWGISKSLVYCTLRCQKHEKGNEWCWDS